MVEGPADRSHAPTPARSAPRRRVVNRYKVAKHFELEIADGAFSFTAQDRADQRRGRARRPLRDPHHLPAPKLASPAAVVRAYKQLKMAERAFRTMKDQIEIRPIHHHLEDRVRAHVFLCMLAYYVAFELHLRLTPLLFTDEQPLAPTDPVAPASARPRPTPKPAAPRPPTATPPTASPT